MERWEVIPLLPHAAGLSPFATADHEVGRCRRPDYPPLGARMEAAKQLPSAELPGVWMGRDCCCRVTAHLPLTPPLHPIYIERCRKAPCSSPPAGLPSLAINSRINGASVPHLLVTEWSIPQRRRHQRHGSNFAF